MGPEVGSLVGRERYSLMTEEGRVMIDAHQTLNGGRGAGYQI